MKHLSVILLVLFALHVSVDSRISFSGFGTNWVPTGVKCLFTKDKACTQTRVEPLVNNREEQGTLARGRSFIQGIKQKVGSVGRELNRFGTQLGIVRISRNTEGLDCNRTFAGNMAEFKASVKAIYPGTKWCGGGDIATSFNDLGKFRMSDACCREHDSCQIKIDAGASDFGLKNTGLFTRSHCMCDRKFYDCLKNANSFVSNSIGFTYFTVLGPQCFQKDYPIVGCLRRQSGKCVDYKMNTRAARIYEWFDNPTY